MAAVGPELDTVTHELLALRAEVSALAAEVRATNTRIDEAILTQVRDHGKRLRELEETVHAHALTLAEDHGRSAGRRATLAGIGAAIAAVCGMLGGLIGKFF